MKPRRFPVWLSLSLGLVLSLGLSGCVSSTTPGTVGVQRSQLLLVSSGQVSQMADTAFREQNSQAASKGTFVRSGAELDRLKRIANRLIAQTRVYRNDTAQWAWQVVLIDEPVINATCYPGGKITFYTGIIRQLRLTDGEIAAIMGHEIAHALREHGREKISQAMLQQTLAGVAAVMAPDKQREVALANQAATILVQLPYSRHMELEADKMGLELMARAGFDPREAVSMQRKLMAASQGGRTPEFLSTHPAGERRVQDLNALLPLVVPLYERTRQENAPAVTAPRG